MNQVISPTTSPLEAIIYDDDNTQYRSNSDELENSIILNQNGLNPLKEYLVEINYTNLDGDTIRHFRTIPGEKLVG